MLGCAAIASRAFLLAWVRPGLLLMNVNRCILESIILYTLEGGEEIGYSYIAPERVAGSTA
jgi:hypothetical protein